MEPRLLIIETSCSPGLVGLAVGEKLLGVRRLEEARRHARDLAPAIQELLAVQGWKPREIGAVIVGRGPGSYTGLRVGIMTAKTLAYATGCALLAIDTFAAIAQQAPEQALRVDVLADAQQDKIYAQPFARSAPGEKMEPVAPLSIQAFPDWLAGLEEATWVSGPGIEGQKSRLGKHLVVQSDQRESRPESLLRLGLGRFRRGERDDFWKLEPLYLRPSAAEEKALQQPPSSPA